MAKNIDSIQQKRELLSSRIAELQDAIERERLGRQFTGIKAESAAEYFGKDWLAKLGSNLDSMDVLKYSEKDGLIPVDIKLSAITGLTDGFHLHFKIGNKIGITTESALYNGNHRIVGVDKTKIILSVPYQGDARGYMSDLKAIKELEKQLKFKMNGLNELDEEVETYNAEIRENDEAALQQTAGILRDIVTAKETIQRKQKDREGSGNYILKIAATVILVAGTALTIWAISGSGKNTSSANSANNSEISI